MIKRAETSKVLVQSICLANSDAKPEENSVNEDKADPILKRAGDQVQFIFEE